MNVLAQLLGGLPMLALAALYRWRVHRGESGLNALLEAAALFGGGVWVAANLLGQFSLLRPEPLRIAWLAVGVAAAIALWRTRDGRANWPRPRGAAEWAIAFGVISLLGLTLTRALLAPPNTVDVLNYHLPRQLMWLQQGSLDPFATINDRQNMMPPLAEVIGVQFLALTGDDYWANLPQWAAYVGLAIGLAVLVRRLGGTRGAAGVAALLGLLLPMAYHEASNAKNDLLATFWIVCGAVQLVAWQAPDFVATRRAALRLALPLTLAWLTKSTAMLFVPPLVLAGMWSWARRTPSRALVRTLAPAVLATVLLIAPFHLRNLAWYGTPLGKHRAEDGGALAAEAFGPGVLASSALRHASLHVASPWAAWNERWLGFVHAAHERLGVDANDRRTTLWILNFEAPYAPDDETIAGAPVHFLGGFPLLCLMAFGVGKMRARWLAIAALAGAALFCVALKWQPWATRLELPLFALGTAAAVAVLDAWLRRWRAAVAGGTVLLAAVAWAPGADTIIRPLWHHPAVWELPRELNYYRQFPRQIVRDAALTQMIAQSGARHVAIESIHDIGYPLMRRLRREAPVVHFAGAPASDRSCDALAALGLGAPRPLRTVAHGRSDWRLVGEGLGDGLYLPDDRVREFGWETRLPAFAGWVRHYGMPLSDWQVPGVGRFASRKMDRPRVIVVYESTGRPLRLRAAIRRNVTAPRELKLTVMQTGKMLGRIDCGTEDAAEFELALPTTTGTQAVELGVDEPARDTFVFTRLQIVDAL